MHVSTHAADHSTQVGSRRRRQPSSGVLIVIGHFSQRELRTLSARLVSGQLLFREHQSSVSALELVNGEVCAIARQRPTTLRDDRGWRHRERMKVALVQVDVRYLDQLGTVVVES